MALPKQRAATSEAVGQRLVEQHVRRVVPLALGDEDVEQLRAV
ncbi:hypothetical protein AB0K48_58090 [Nonomuraea sp. NPDC055795]